MSMEVLRRLVEIGGGVFNGPPPAYSMSSPHDSPVYTVVGRLDYLLCISAKSDLFLLIVPYSLTPVYDN
jgi:hypothetical protein